MADSVTAAPMAESAKYIVRNFLDTAHLQTLHGTLSHRWDRMHSLSAAVRLMQAHGVVLTPAEEDTLAAMDEGTQISALVGKMPQQTNEQFHHFFLQLQCLVATATRLRQGLQAGNHVDVQAAMHDAEATGIAPYLTRVAVVQAGLEVTALKGQYKGWCKEADEKLGKLVRGQYECTSMQRKLAAADTQLKLMADGQSTKSATLVTRFVKASDGVSLKSTFQEWQRVYQMAKMEAALETEFKARLENVEGHHARWKAEQLEKSRGTLMKSIMAQQASLVEDAFEVWRASREEAKFQKENGDKISALEAKLANAQVAHREKAKKALERMSTASDGKLVELSFQSWVAFRKEAAQQAQADEAKQKVQARIAEFTRSKAENAKTILAAMTGASDTGAVSMCFQGWAEAFQTAKREAAVANIFDAQSSKLASFASRTKQGGGSAMERAALHVQEMTKLRAFSAWKTDAKMEKSLRVFHAMIEAKRQQLQGVQHMFRNFASQLDQGLNKASTHDLRDYSERRGRRPSGAGVGGAGGGGDSQRQLSKSQGSLSLPAINMSPGSRPPSSAGSVASRPSAKQAWH